MIFRPNPSLGVPIYLQLMEQVKHAIETGALRPGEQLPGIRPLAEELVINPNTVAKAYRELEHEGVIELRHGAGAFVSAGGQERRSRPTACGRRSPSWPPPSSGCATRADRRRDPALVRSRARRADRRQEDGVSESLAIETVDLRKRFDATDALRGLNLRVPQGSIFGFLGRNGAGKTTTIKLLLGMARPTAGQARVLGLPADDAAASVTIRTRTGFVGENKELYDYMTVEEIIRFTAAFYPGWRRDLEKRYLRAFELPRTRRRTRSRSACAASSRCCWRCVAARSCSCSTSRRRVSIRRRAKRCCRRSSRTSTEELTVFFSSHHIADVDQIADHIAIIDAGRTIVTGALDDLRGQYRRVQLVFNGEAPDITFHAPGVVRVRPQGRVLTALSNAGGDAAHRRGACDSDRSRPTSCR